MDDIYELCRCDRTRRRNTSLDGYNMACGKCIICGMSGHYRQMPGSLKTFEAGWCEYHYAKIEKLSTKQIKNAFSTAKQDPERAAHLLCRKDMGTAYYEALMNHFFTKKKCATFDRDFIDYFKNGDIEKFMQHFPESMPHECIVRLTRRFEQQYSMPNQ